jgi:geranylgeranyl diphosphate synthase, type I
MGALLAGAPEPVVTALDRAGRHVGVAFQAVDDLLGMWGDPQVTGKPVHGDLRRRKKTLPVLAALAADCPAARELAALLSSSLDADAPGAVLDHSAARRAAELVDEAGGRAATLAEARHQLDAARAHLASVPLAPTAAAELLALLPFLVDRAL